LKESEKGEKYAESEKERRNQSGKSLSQGDEYVVANTSKKREERKSGNESER